MDEPKRHIRTNNLLILKCPKKVFAAGSFIPKMIINTGKNINVKTTDPDKTQSAIKPKS